MAIKPTVDNPHYSAVIISNGGTYDVTNLMTDLTLTENEDEIAQKVLLTIANIKYEGDYMTNRIDVRNRVFIYADTGGGQQEVFRGFVWIKSYSSKLEKLLTLTCYDNMIYMQESEEYQYFPAGQSTSAIFSALCGKWGVQLSYKHVSITHPKLPLRGQLGDIFINDLLGEVRKKTGKRGIMRSEKDQVQVLTEGSNSTVYNFKMGAGGNTISTQSEVSMEGMITKVVILGKEDNNERASVAATVTGDTGKYGTLQKIINSSEGTTMADSKSEANELIKEKGKPTRSYAVEAVDVPWVRKGDKVSIAAGDIIGNAIVRSITHDAQSKTMTMEVRLL